MALAGPESSVVSKPLILVIIGLAAITILSLVPGNFQIRTGLPKEIEHFGAYFAVAFVIVSARPSASFMIFSVVLLSLVAGGMEVLQEFVPERNGAFLDAVASAAGAAGGAAAAFLWSRKRRVGRSGARMRRLKSDERSEFG
jgi:VanZ family protein